VNGGNGNKFSVEFEKTRLAEALLLSSSQPEPELIDLLAIQRQDIAKRPTI
jgi:hypothetical protein